MNGFLKGVLHRMNRNTKKKERKYITPTNYLLKKHRML